MAETEDKKRKRRKGPWIAAAILLLLVGLALSVPAILCAIAWPEVTIDLTEGLGDNAALFTNRTASVKVHLRRRHGGGFIVRARGHALDWPFSARADVSFSGLGANGNLSARLDDTPWRANATFRVQGLGGWDAQVSVPETAFSEQDPVLAHLLSRLPMPAVSNLAFAGSIAIDAKADRTSARPVPAWTATADLRGLNASLAAGGTPVALNNLSLKARASGIADHLDIAPIRPRADSIEAAGFALTNFYATVMPGERTHLVTEAGAELCGGAVRIYSLRLNPESLSTGFTLFLDDIDAGEVLSHITCFNGTASGRLHGKIPLYVKDGRTLRLRDAFLYSTPGAVGSVRVNDPTPITDNLALGGVSESARDNLARALANLDYSVLALDLKRESEGGLALTFRVEGTATSGEITVPVVVAVTFHGDIEQLLNTGLSAMRK